MSDEYIPYTEHIPYTACVPHIKDAECAEPAGQMEGAVSGTSHPPSTAVRIVIADDNPVVRAGLAALLRGQEGLTVVAEAADGAQAYEAVVSHRPDLVLLDVRMPGVDGISVLPHLVGLAPVLMMTYSSESRIVHEALRRGAGGYLVHGEFTVEQLVSAIHDITAGRAVFSPSASGALLAGIRGDQLADRIRGPLPDGLGASSPSFNRTEPSQLESLLSGAGSRMHLQYRAAHAGLAQRQYGPVEGKLSQLSSLKQANVGHSCSGGPVTGRPQGVLGELSRREVEVMELIASGLSNQQIAASCFISMKTVKNHINRIFAKLNAQGRGEAIDVWRGVVRREAGPR
ncbi:response regulator transcription factor [Streptomyces sp. NPDC005963]|uniref:response regulator transcription factor n=1 Tax=Streptomyces sp. NPDC005963 TaxID=3156721 RepID=UPI0033F12045